MNERGNFGKKTLPACGQHVMSGEKAALVMRTDAAPGQVRNILPDLTGELLIAIACVLGGRGRGGGAIKANYGKRKELMEYIRQGESMRSW